MARDTGTGDEIDRDAARRTVGPERMRCRRLILRMAICEMLRDPETHRRR